MALTDGTPGNFLFEFFYFILFLHGEDQLIWFLYPGNSHKEIKIFCKKSSTNRIRAFFTLV